MNHPMSVRAYVKLRTQQPIEREPDFSNVGGFTVKGTDGYDYNFDWLESGGHTFEEDGRFAIEWNLRDFDHVYFLESNGGRHPDWDAILDGDIIEVHHENGYLVDGGEEALSDMELVDFIIYDWNAEDSLDEYPFSEDQVDAYNKRALATQES